MSSARRKPEEEGSGAPRWARVLCEPTGITWLASMLTVAALEEIMWLDLERALILSISSSRRPDSRSKRLGDIEGELNKLVDSLRAVTVLHGAGEC